MSAVNDLEIAARDAESAEVLATSKGLLA